MQEGNKEFYNQLFSASPYYSKLQDYQRKTLLTLFGMTDIQSLRGMKVAEIGGNGDYSVARLFTSLTEMPVSVYQPDNCKNIINSSELRIINLEFEKSEAQPASLDIIYGCAVLEHICNLQQFSAKCRETLKPGGWLLLQGGPMWNSPLGHHLYIHTDKYHHTFTHDNILPPWAHLIFNREGMRTWLRNSGHPKELCDMTVEQVYDSPSLNRLSSTRILSLLGQEEWQFAVDAQEFDVPENLRSHKDMTGAKCVFTMYISARNAANEKEAHASETEMPEKCKPLKIQGDKAEAAAVETTISSVAICGQGGTGELLNNHMHVNWELTFMCNYRCSYCFGQLPLDKGKFSTFAQLRHAADVIISLNKNSYSFVFSGGEPTTHGHFMDILTYLADKLGDKLNYVQVITNGSRQSSLYTQLVKASSRMPLNMLVSIHSEFANMEHIAELIRSLAPHASLSFNLMFNPAKRGLIKDIHAQLCGMRTEYPFGCNITLLRKGQDYSVMDDRYVAEDFAWIDEANSIFNRIASAPAHRFHWRSRHATSKYWDTIVDGEFRHEEFTHYDRGTLLRQGRFHFKGLWCALGAAFIAIRPNGMVQGGICSVAPSKYNIFRQNPYAYEDFVQAAQCPLSNCGCGANDVIPKFDTFQKAENYIRETQAFSDYPKLWREAY